MKNPHARYEIYLAPLPKLVLLSFIAIAVGAILGTIYLTSTTPGDVIPMPHLHMPKIPSVPAMVRHEVDSHNPLLKATTEAR